MSSEIRVFLKWTNSTYNRLLAGNFCTVEFSALNSGAARAARLLVTFLLAQKSNQKRAPRKPTLGFRAHFPPATPQNPRSALFVDVSAQILIQEIPLEFKFCTSAH
jgi:hypothetical protein